MGVYFLSDLNYKPEWKAWREAVKAKSREACSQVMSAYTVAYIGELPRVEWPAAPD